MPKSGDSFVPTNPPSPCKSRSSRSKSTRRQMGTLSDCTLSVQHAPLQMLHARHIRIVCRDPTLIVSFLWGGLPWGPPG